MGVKVEKQLKVRRTYSSVPSRPTILLKPFNSQISDPPPKEDKDKGNGKEVAKEVPKGQ